jgi:hypothetical protein
MGEGCNQPIAALRHSDLGEVSSPVWSFTFLMVTLALRSSAVPALSFYSSMKMGVWGSLGGGVVSHFLIPQLYPLAFPKDTICTHNFRGKTISSSREMTGFFFPLRLEVRVALFLPSDLDMY